LTFVMMPQDDRCIVGRGKRRLVDVHADGLQSRLGRRKAGLRRGGPVTGQVQFLCGDSVKTRGVDIGAGGGSMWRVRYRSFS
jgi:hypothetical protein